MKLLTLLACEKVLFDQEQNASLISVFQNINIELRGDVPEQAIAPQPWTLFSIWDRDPEDVGKRFRQVFQLSAPDDKPLPLKGQLDFDVKDELAVNYVKVVGFPVGREGAVTIKTWLESLGGEVLSPTYYYPVMVKHVRISPPVSEVKA